MELALTVQIHSDALGATARPVGTMKIGFSVPCWMLADWLVYSGTYKTLVSVTENANMP